MTKTSFIEEKQMNQQKLLTCTKWFHSTWSHSDTVGSSLETKYILLLSTTERFTITTLCKVT